MALLSSTSSRTALAALLGSALAAAIYACGGSNDNLPPPPPPPPPPASASAAPTSTTPPDTGTPSKTPAPPITLTPGAASPDPTAPLPTVKISTPSSGQVLDAKAAPDFTVKLDVKNWQTAKGSSHVHLILDNKPYRAVYDTKEAIKLSELNGGDALAEGLHVLVSFPSRANHESVKTKDALAITPFWIGKKGTTADPTKKPMLIYSRPKGAYNGEMANHVLVDFQVANVTLAEGKEHVHVTVSGPGLDKPVEGSVEKFGTPLYLDNLQNGSYQLKVELVDGSNKLIDGPWNSTTRTITVDHDAAMDPSMAMPSMGGDAGAPAADAGAKKK